MIVFPVKKTNRKSKDNQEKVVIQETKPLGPISLATRIVESKDWTYSIKFDRSTTFIKG